MKEQDKKIFIVILIGLLSLMALTASILVIHNKKNQVKDTYEVVDNTQSIINNNISEQVDNQTNNEYVSEDYTDEIKENEIQETFDDGYEINETTRKWLMSKTFSGVNILGETNDKILDDFNNGIMFANNKIENTEYYEDDVWWIAVDKSNSEKYNIYISAYYYLDETDNTYKDRLSERVGTRPIKLVITNKDILDKIDWCINNYPENTGMITDGLKNAQYLLLIRNTPHDVGFSETNNYANTIHRDSWAGLDMWTITSKYIAE